MTKYTSAQKAHIQSIKRKIRNKTNLSKITTYTKKLLLYIKTKDLERATNTFNLTQSFIQKATNKKIIKTNNAKRKISKLHIKLKKIQK